jgi:hypothetical protein
MDSDLITLYQERGFSFFPLRKKSKKPIFDWAAWQTRRPSNEEVKTWQDQGLLNQVAIVCGAISGIFVLDVDDPEVFDSWMLAQHHPMPPSPTVRTGKGRHIYFRHPGGKIKNSTKKIPGADIKADGGYVVAPPSIHPGGKPYEWIEFLDLSQDMSDPPPWLTEFIEREVSATVAVSTDDLLRPDEDWVTEALRGVAEGERNHIAAKLAGWYLGRGDSTSQTLEQLRGWNLRNLPGPLPDKELRAAVASVGRAEAKKRIRTQAGQGIETPDTSGLPWDEQRQAALQGLGERLGLPITDIRSTKTDNSIWEIVLGDEGSVIVTAPQLVEQGRFSTRMIAAAHLVPKPVPKAKNGHGGWIAVVKDIIRLAVNMEAGPEGTAQGEVQDLINNFISMYRGIEYISPAKKIPAGAPFFIVHRDGAPCLYARLDQIYLQAKSLGYKLTRRDLISLLPGLGHETERFSWQGQTIRAWKLNLDVVPSETKLYVFKKAGENDATRAENDGKNDCLCV